MAADTSQRSRRCVARLGATLTAPVVALLLTVSLLGGAQAYAQEGPKRPAPSELATPGDPGATGRTLSTRPARMRFAVVPRLPMAGERLLMRGVTGTRGRRPVVLQQLVPRSSGDGFRWQRLARTRSFPKGRFRLNWVMVDEAVFVRVKAPRTRVNGQRLRPERSPGKTLRPEVQDIDATYPVVLTQGESATVTGTASPARGQRLMGLQQRTDGPWRFVSFAQQDFSGGFELDLPTVTPRRAEVRVIGGPYNGAAAVRDEIAAVEVVRDPIGATLRVVGGAETTTDDGRPAVAGRPDVVVEPAEPVTGIEIFVDGRPGGSATETEDGSWVWTWDTVRLSDGAHDVVARLETGARRGVSEAARVLTQQPASSAALTGLPEGFRAETLAAGLFLPTTFEPLDARRVLVAEKDGLVRLVRDGVVDPDPVIDVSDHVLSRDDVGLLGMTLDPAFDPTNLTGFVYLAYTYLEDADQAERFEQTHVVTRVRLRDGTQVEETPLLGTSVADCPTADTPGCMPFVGTGHAIGELLFDATGALLVTVGDGALYAGDSPENVRSQDLDVLAGKVLRVDPETGLGLPDNPFFVGDGARTQNRDRVWAYGLRNPFRSGRDADGSLLIGDVGEDAFEEINRLERGANYGWPCFEAEQQGPSFLREAGRSPSCPSLAQRPAVPTDPTGPIHYYRHDPEAGGAISGGVALATATGFPAEYRDRFLYADYALGQMRLIDAATLDSGDSADARQAYEPFASREAVATPVRTRIGPDGTVWFLTIFPGELRRIVYDADGTTSCAVGTWRAEWYADGEISGTPDAVTCEQTAEAFPRPPGIPERGSGVRFEGRFRFAGGAYEFVASGAGPTRFVLDDEVIFDTFGTGGNSGKRFVRSLTPGLHRARLDYVDERGVAASEAVWEPTTAFPQVSVEVPGGTYHYPGEEIAWAVTATDSTGADITDSAEVTLEVLHYPGDTPHLHPAFTDSGPAGSATLTEDHAEGRMAYRLTAKATDDEGHPTTSAPVYLCLEGNAVGICS